MKIVVQVKPNAKANEIDKINDGEYVVRVKAPPKENKANEELINVLAEYFKVPKSRIRILKGHGSKTKVVEIDYGQTSR